MYLRQTSQYHIDFSVTNDKTNKNFSRGRNSLRGWIWSRTRWLKRFPERISRYDSSDCKYFISDVQSHGNSHHQSLNLELYDRKYGFIKDHGLWYIANCCFGSKFLSKEFIWWLMKFFDKSYHQNTNFWPTYCMDNVWFMLRCNK